MSKRNFNFTEGELYALCLAGWDTCSKYIQELNAFSPTYSAEYAIERKNEVLDTMSRFNRKQRTAEMQLLRDDLKSNLDAVLKLWRSLKHYAETTFKNDRTEAFLVEAGSAHYLAARNKQWEEAIKLMQSGNLFIAKYKNELIANKNMPENFDTEFDKQTQSYGLLYNRYLRAGVDARENTLTHQELLNKLYDDVTRMFAAGKEVFKGNKVVYDQFRVRVNMDVISGSGWAGIKGKIFDENGKQRWIPDLLISLPETEDEVGQNEDGTFILNHLSAGTYTLTVKAPGYVDWQKEVEIKQDTYSSFDVKLEKVEVLSPL